MSPITFFVILWNRISHLISEPKRIKKLEQTIETIRKGYDRSKTNRMPHFQRIYNVGLYFLVLEHDVVILKNDALFSFRKWKKAFVARQLAIVLYEASHDLPDLLGKDFRDSLKKLPLTEADWDRFQIITKQINQFKSNNREILSEIRNFVGAHRDKDAGKQLEIIDQVDLLKIMELAANFYDAVRDFVPFLTRLTLILADWRVFLKHAPPDAFK